MWMNFHSILKRAPIGVLSRWERDTTNYPQARGFAEAFAPPFVRWPLTIAFEGTLGLRKEELDRLRAEEPERPWGYFAELAPFMMTANIKAVRKLVNGTPALGDSLQFESSIVPEQLRTAYANGVFREVTLEKPPKAINLRVGGERVTWHGVPLDDLSDLIESITPDAQVVPIMEGLAEEVYLKSVAAAQFGLDVVEVKEHSCRLAFAMTDFKLQGRTLPKLILSIYKRPTPPWMELTGFYVLISRVRTMEGLRVFYRNEQGLAHLRTLQWKL